MDRIRRTLRHSLAGLLIAATALSCDQAPTSPVVFTPDAATLEKAVLVSVDLNTNTATATPVSGGGASRSLVGHDVIDARITGLTRVSYGRKQDLVKFDLSIVNRITGVQLVPPTEAPNPPNGRAAVFVFPYDVTVTRGRGDIDESDDWRGDRFGFFGSERCRRNTVDCFPWVSFPAPLLPGQATAPKTVGFIVDKDVRAFDVYLLTAADLAPVPTGSLEVSVTSAAKGALAGVTVSAGELISAATDASGLARFASIGTGPHAVSVSQLPSGCSSPAAVTASVAAGQTTRIDVDIVCQVLTGAVHGFVRTSDNTGTLATSGLQVRLNPAGTTVGLDAEGRYLFENVPAGSHSVSLTNVPGACRNQNPAAVTMTGEAVEINYQLECPPPVIIGFTRPDEVFMNGVATATVNAASPAGGALTYAWTIVGGTGLAMIGETANYRTRLRPGIVSLTVTVSDGVHSVTGSSEQFAMRRPGHGVFVSEASGLDGFPGTRAKPYASVAAAFAKATAESSDIYLTEGTYAATETLDLPAGTGVYGGLDASWNSTDSRSTINGATTAMTVTGRNNVILDHLVVTSANAIIPGSSSIGVFVKSSSITLTEVRLKSGNGAAGTPGAAGATGPAGSDANGRNGGANADPLMAPGGRGGLPGYCGSGGQAGESVGDAIGGAAPGGVGMAGSDGGSGMDGFAFPGTFTANGYVPGVSIAATDGLAGTSGAGGGGTQGGRSGFSCYEGNPGYGGGGGGGGGRAPQSSGGGGASVPLYFVQSAVFATNLTLATGDGGRPGTLLQTTPSAGGEGGGSASGTGGGGKGGRGGPSGWPINGFGGDIAGYVNVGPGSQLVALTPLTIELGRPGTNNPEGRYSGNGTAYSFVNR